MATGQVLRPSLGPTRTEVDFVAHIAQTVAQDPTAEWIFIVDQLNTQQSAGLVEGVTAQCAAPVALGAKGKAGILATMPSRAAFLSDPAHRIRFVYVPKHTSWLNQVEMWFSILVRRLLKRASFRSPQELQERIEAFIAYFNQTAKPFKWTCTGRPLVA